MMDEDGLFGGGWVTESVTVINGYPAGWIGDEIIQIEREDGREQGEEDARKGGEEGVF